MPSLPRHGHRDVRRRLLPLCHQRAHSLRRNNIRNLRNTFDFEVPNYRLQSTLNSYFPSTIRLWNNLEQDLRHNYTQNQFKSILNSRRDCFVIPSYYNVGDRKSNILLTKLRNSCSSLNADLFRVNLTDSPSCRCGHHNEDVFHYLFHCPLYNDQRQTLGNQLYNYIPLTSTSNRGPRAKSH